MDNIDNIFANTAVFCKECGQQIKPGDRFCTYCGSTQTQEINIEPVNVEKKMRRRAAELLPCLKLPAGYMPLMSDGLPA
ncbi:MAG: zinc ribbon domain-containing protein, partial [Treponema sp.]|nr:zinc ribbon domain-containing protein [Treponema sp.]